MPLYLPVPVSLNVLFSPYWNRKVPSQRQIRADLKVDLDKAKAIQAELTALLAERVPVTA